MAVPKPFKFIGLVAMNVTEPNKFEGFGAMADTKPCACIGSESVAVTEPYRASLDLCRGSVSGGGLQEGRRCRELGPISRQARRACRQIALEPVQKRALGGG